MSKWNCAFQVLSVSAAMRLSRFYLLCDSFFPSIFKQVVSFLADYFDNYCTLTFYFKFSPSILCKDRTKHPRVTPYALV